MLNRSQVVDEMDQRPDLTEDVRYLVDALKRMRAGKSGRALEANRRA